MSKSIIVSCIGAASILSGLAGAAHAQDASIQRTERVSYTDLDLAHAAGQTALAHRIHAAARSVCGPVPEWKDRASADDYQRCMKSAQEGAMAEMRQAVAAAGGEGVIRLAQSDSRR